MEALAHNGEIVRISVFFCKQKTAYEMRISDWSADVCSSDLLKARLGGRTAIGARIDAVQGVFKKIFNVEADFATDGRQFDKLFEDGETFGIGGLEARVMHTPGHTPA